MLKIYTVSNYDPTQHFSVAHVLGTVVSLVELLAHTHESLTHALLKMMELACGSGMNTTSSHPAPRLLINKHSATVLTVASIRNIVRVEYKTTGKPLLHLYSSVCLLHPQAIKTYSTHQQLPACLCAASVSLSCWALNLKQSAPPGAMDCA
jgi:hypothetical protein